MAITIDYDNADLAAETRQWLTAVGATINSRGGVFLDYERLTVYVDMSTPDADISPTYSTRRHPDSGETFAVELDEYDNILRVYGPLSGDEPTDPDADWFRGELARSER